MISQQKFLEAIEAFLKRHGLAAANFGVAVLGDPNFVSDLRNSKRSPSIRTAERVESYMANYKKGASKVADQGG